MVFTFFHTEYYHVFSVLFLLHRDKLIAIDSDVFLFSYLGQTSKWFQFLTTSWSLKNLVHDKNQLWITLADVLSVKGTVEFGGTFMCPCVCTPL